MERTAQLVHTIDVLFYEMDSFWCILLPHNFDFIVILVYKKEIANSGHCKHTVAHPLVNDMYARKFFCREMNAYFFGVGLDCCSLSFTHRYMRERGLYTL